MLKRAAQWIVEQQIRRAYLKEEERSLYIYAYELLLNQVINIVLSILIACLFRAPLTVLIFLVCYIPFRSFAGGYHADTNLGCTVVSAVMLCCVCLLMDMEAAWWLKTVYPAFFVLSGYMVFRYAPVQDKNKPLDDLERVRYKKRSRVMWGLETTAGMVCYCWKVEQGLVIAIGHLLLAGILVLGSIKNRKNV